MPTVHVVQIYRISYSYASDQYFLSQADNLHVTCLFGKLFVDLVSIFNFVELLTNSLVQGILWFCCFFEQTCSITKLILKKSLSSVMSVAKHFPMKVAY